MRTRDTDKDWESLAHTEPYWAVLTHDRFRSAVITDNDLAYFFASGEEHISSTLSGIRRLFDPEFRPQFALDFGCGVGRLLLPLARVSTRTAGVDISDEMLRMARKHLDAHHLSAELAKTAEGFAGYDLLVSAIVFQHIV